jgi:hypothetical protein
MISYLEQGKKAESVASRVSHHEVVLRLINSVRLEESLSSCFRLIPRGSRTTSTSRTICRIEKEQRIWLGQQKIHRLCGGKIGHLWPCHQHLSRRVKRPGENDAVRIIPYYCSSIAHPQEGRSGTGIVDSGCDGRRKTFHTPLSIQTVNSLECRVSSSPRGIWSGRASSRRPLILKVSAETGVSLEKHLCLLFFVFFRLQEATI